MKIDVVVFFTCSNTITVEIPDEVGDDLDAQRDAVKAILDKDLPEVHEGSSFEFPVSFQLGGDGEETDLG